MKAVFPLRSPRVLGGILVVGHCRRAVSALEFALILPMFVAFALAGFELTNMMMTTLKVQRLATMTADMVAQRGASEKRLNELQMYDILSAMDVAARPLDMRENGRIVVTALIGEDTNADNNADVNRIKWQRFAGGRLSTTPLLGCHTTSTIATIRNSRQLGRDETMFHVQVTYAYQPLLGLTSFDMLTVPDVVTRTAAFRGRGGSFNPILAVDKYPAKDNCTA